MESSPHPGRASYPTASPNPQRRQSPGGPACDPRPGPRPRRWRGADRGRTLRRPRCRPSPTGTLGGAGWEVFRAASIPGDKILIPGVIDSVTNFIEHPKLVAERLCRFADIVGRERVMAGADCGFSTFAGVGRVDEDIVYAKFKAMAEDASALAAIDAIAAVEGIHCLFVGRMALTVSPRGFGSTRTRGSRSGGPYCEGDSRRGTMCRDVRRHHGRSATMARTRRLLLPDGLGSIVPAGWGASPRLRLARPSGRPYTKPRPLRIALGTATVSA